MTPWFVGCPCFSNNLVILMILCHMLYSFFQNALVVTVATLNGDDIIVHEEHEADQYTSIGKKGQQRIEQMAEIQKIVTSAGWLDQCPDGPLSMDFAEIEPEV